MNEPFIILHYFRVIVHMQSFNLTLSRKVKWTSVKFRREVHLILRGWANINDLYHLYLFVLHICTAHHLFYLFIVYFCFIVFLFGNPLFRTTLICTWSLNMYPVVKCFHIFAKSGASGKWLFFWYRKSNKEKHQ